MESPLVEIADLVFRWRPSEPVILDIGAFSVGRGERVFLRGPSGSGKTTLLNLLGGVAVPQSGTVRILGTDIPRLSGPQRDRFRADHVGFIFQQFNLVPYLGLIENVVLPCRFSAVRRRRAAERGGTPEAEARRLLAGMKLDVDDLSGRSVSRLSVGQQQRVAAARSLIGAPELVIADEPTSSIDEEARRAFLSLLFDEIGRAGATLLFVSHERSLEAQFGRIVALADINRAAQRA